MNIIPDRYTALARVTPAMLVAVPVAFLVMALWPDAVVALQALASAGCWIVATVVAAQLGRDAGKEIENHLFRIWGGIPTTQLLRFNNNPNPEQLLRRRKLITQLMPDLLLPDEQAEAADPASADRTYETVVLALREMTRDKSKFSLLFEENCNYGFRRNTLGRRSWGLGTSIASFLVAAGYTAWAWMAGVTPTVGDSIGIVGALLVFLIWHRVVTPDWVRVAAFAYADRLLSSTEVLVGGSTRQA